MRPMIPRVAAIHDLSGFGRSSLCNVLPILSTMGIQACPVPTAVLSTHSGGFDGYTFRDLTEDIPDFIRDLMLNFLIMILPKKFVHNYFRTAIIMFRRIRNITADWVNLKNLWLLRVTNIQPTYRKSLP